MAIVQIDKQSEDQIEGIAEHLLKDPHTKIIVFVDKDVDIYSPLEVTWALCMRVRFPIDMHFKEDLPGLVIDPLVKGGRGKELLTSKLVIDATMPLEYTSQLEKVDIPAPTKSRVKDLLAERGLI